MRLRYFLMALAMLCPVAAHASLPCSAYPFTLTNGTLADANQVMSNFNNILTCVNSLAPLGTPVIGGASNVRAGLGTAGTSITVNADSVTVGTALNGTSYTLTSYAQSFNGATTGAGGMDTGSLPTNGYVALYAIYNPTAPSTSILGYNCSAACGTIYPGVNMPSGYTASGLLAVLKTNATPALAVQFVKGKTVTFAAANSPTTTVNVSSGTSASISAVIPPNAISIGGNLFVQCGTTPGSTNTDVIVGADTTMTGQLEVQGSCNAVSGNTFETPFANLLITTSQTLFWGATVAGTSPQGLVQITAYTIP